jgi:hypothetical protein
MDSRLSTRVSATSQRIVLGVIAAIAVAGAGVALGLWGASKPRAPIAASSTSTTPTPSTAGPSNPFGRPRLVVGIGEQQAAMFSDPRFKALHIDKARIVVAYDAARVTFERQLTDVWLAEARRAGVEPFVTFGHSRVHPDKLPSIAEFRAAFRAFRARYPDVRVYAAWNEINHDGQPTHDHPERAAEYYDVVKAQCHGCLVVAGDVLDQKGMTTYLKRYRSHIDGEPQAWGLHNYTDVNRFRSRGLKAMLKAVPGEIWLTETGGLVQLAERLERDEQRAARATAFMLKLARSDPRVARLYLYNWTGTDAKARFDSGLIAPDGRARPAYDVLKRELAEG